MYNNEKISAGCGGKKGGCSLPHINYKEIKFAYLIKLQQNLILSLYKKYNS